MFEVDAGNMFHVSKTLEPYVTLLPPDQYYNPQYYIETLDFVPEYILNCRDDFSGTLLEYELSIHYDTKTKFDDRALKFFTSKKEQDRVCKLMNVPTLDEGTIDDAIIVKLDNGYSGGTGFKKVDKKDYVPGENDFIQRYVDYDYTIMSHVLVDGNGEYHVYNHCIDVYGTGGAVANNVPYMVQYPFSDLPKEEIDIIENFFTKLKDNITVKNRILMSEFSKERNGKFNFQELNSRPAGGFELGNHDWKIGKFNTLVDLFTSTVADEIEHYQQVTEIYADHIRNDVLFGWGSYDGIETAILPYSETIKVFNTIE
jgi:hypothetical protein